MQAKLQVDVSQFTQQLLGVEQDDLRDKYLEVLCALAVCLCVSWPFA